MKFKIGDLVRIGGKNGIISKVIAFRDGIYTVSSLNGMVVGYSTVDYLFKIKDFEQLSLF